MPHSHAGAPSRSGRGFKVSTDGMLDALHVYGPRDVSSSAGPPVVIPSCLRSGDKKTFLLFASGSVVEPLPYVACIQGPPSVLIQAGPHKPWRR